MTDYPDEKRKRKNEDAPALGANILRSIGALLKSFWKYLIFLPSKFVLVHSFNILKWAVRIAWDATLWSIKAPFRAGRWLWNFFFGEVTPPIENYRQMVYWQFRRGIRRRNRFLLHGFIYLAGFIVVLVSWIAVSRRAIEDGNNIVDVNNIHFLMLVFWTLPLIFHFIRMQLNQAADDTLMQNLEQEHQHELEMQRLQSQNSHYYEHLTTEYADESDYPYEESAPVAKVKRR